MNVDAALTSFCLFVFLALADLLFFFSFIQFYSFVSTDCSTVFVLYLLLVVQFVTHSNNSQPVIELSGMLFSL